MSDLMKVSSNPHIRSKDSTSRIMLAVIIALLPTTIFGIYNFGIRALLIVAITIASTVLTEFVFEKITKRKNTIGDLSAVVTGLLLAPCDGPVHSSQGHSAPRLQEGHTQAASRPCTVDNRLPVLQSRDANGCVVRTSRYVDSAYLLFRQEAASG